MTYLTIEQFRAKEGRNFQPAKRKLSVPFWAIVTALSIVTFAITFNLLS